MISDPPEWTSSHTKPRNGKWLKRQLKKWFRYVDYPFLLGYRGYGNTQRMKIQGHVFKGMALIKPRKKHSAWKNFVTLIKMFLVRTVPEARVELTCQDQRFVTRADANGFFEFDVAHPGLSKGWHKVKIVLLDELVEDQQTVQLKSEVLIESDFEYGLISDIDDTFLVSHVTKIWRKLYVLLTKNAETRKPFKGVVQFYTNLSEGVTSRTNPFFYVSSSEWNLYDFLINFMRFHKLPKGVLQLKQIKDSFLDFFRSGYGSHNHKEVKIERILKMYPRQSFILLGDNGQHDPYIYKRVAEAFPGRIKAVYIRGVKRSNRSKVEEVMAELRQREIPALQFKNSAEARQHALEHQFITAG